MLLLMRCSLLLLPIAALSSFKLTATTAFQDTCQLYILQEDDIWVTSCIGGCDEGNCHQITATNPSMSRSVTTCFCGAQESSAICLGALVNNDGDITVECERNGCETACVNGNPEPGKPVPACFCP